MRFPERSGAAGVLFQAPRGACGIPRVPVATYSMHGGAGALLSVGLLRAIDFGGFEDCVATTYSTGYGCLDAWGRLPLPLSQLSTL